MRNVSKLSAMAWISRRKSSAAKRPSPSAFGGVFDVAATRDPWLTSSDSSTLVFDTVYNPMETKLLRQAKDAGAKTASGVDMFVRQAIGQFELWTEKRAPVELMRQTLKSVTGAVKQVAPQED